MDKESVFTKTPHSLSFVWKDRIPYLESLKIQEGLKQDCLQNQKSFLFGFECPTTVTLGLRGGEGDLLLSREEFSSRDIPIVSIKRGGQATLHSLGQLVLYPVLEIKRSQMRVRDFVHFIEEVTKDVLKDMGIKTHKEEGQAGLFTNKGKIAFFGLHITDGVSQHGLAINVNNDLNLFSYIRSCGTTNRPHDSVKNYHPDITVKHMFDLWSQKFVSKKITHQKLNGI